MNKPSCPRCQSQTITKSGIIKNRQRYHCKDCSYHFTVEKLGKAIDPYYVVKALQLYLEGLTYREIERVLGLSHVSVMNWVRMYQMQRPKLGQNYHPNYQILTQSELLEVLKSKEYLLGHGLLISELGDKFMVIRWERFRD